MTPGRVVIILLLAVILGVPLTLRPERDARRPSTDENTLVVITPHVPQIQEEFGKAFDRWHRREFGAPAFIDWRQPGGTSDILKVLEAHYQAVAKAGGFSFDNPANPAALPGACAYDAMLGGGSYEHTKLRLGVKVDGGRVVPMSVPADIPQADLDAWFGENRIGAQTLYDPEHYWIGTALSGFGIVYNRDILKRLGVPEPRSFRDMADPRLAGWVTFADPRQSGSAGTSLDAILSREGWDAGWKLLREMCANSRSFTNSSPKPPIDVSHGEAAMGLAIDFYGRGQAQAIAGNSTTDDRVGYVDPKGETYIDADPISILRGGPNPELARRFVRFCLSDEGQALWQFHATLTSRGATNPPGPDGRPMGPERHELRRMPVRRSFYARFDRAMIDHVNPFELASEARPAGWRSAILLMMGAFAMDNARDLRAAWRALNEARTSGDAARLAEMERLFYAFPDTTLPEGAILAFTEGNYKAIAAAWRDPSFKTRCEIEYTAFFRENYRRVVALGKRGTPTAPQRVSGR
ncbi:MAG: hypothetical protein HBSAPP03_21070 [Phycisphaerae bacterium]|nr:MAG: hypothetical protein HBSAPP03_21070 [Phycisphaerae bacterium]